NLSYGSAAGMLRAVVTDETFNCEDDRPPAVAWADTVIYEAHLSGLSMLHEEVHPRERGTFATLAEQHVIEYLRELGITAIELMPIHAFVRDRHLLQMGLQNYWGYNTIGFFAVEPRYLATGTSTEMRVAIRR